MWPLKWIFLLGLVVLAVRSAMQEPPSPDKDGYQSLLIVGMILGGLALFARDVFLLIRKRASETELRRSSRFVAAAVGGLATAVLISLVLSGHFAGAP